MTQDLRGGTIDAAQGIPGAQFPALQGDGKLKAIAYNYINWDYFDFNCYDGVKSKGDPVLRDPAFRVALDYAIDRDKICELVYNGRAKPGYTLINADTWRDPDFHWEPPAGVKRPFDIAKANELLDAAGYRRHERRRHPRRHEGQADRAAPLGACRVHLDPGRGQAHHRLVRAARPRHPLTRSSTTAWPATPCTPGTATIPRPTTT